MVRDCASVRLSARTPHRLGKSEQCRPVCTMLLQLLLLTLLGCVLTLWQSNVMHLVALRSTVVERRSSAGELPCLALDL